MSSPNYKHFRVFAKQHGILTVKETIRDLASKIPLPDIDLKFEKGKPIWYSEKSQYTDEQLDQIYNYILERMKRDDTYVILAEDLRGEKVETKSETEVSEVSEVSEVKTTTGPRTTAHQGQKKTADK